MALGSPFYLHMPAGRPLTQNETYGGVPNCKFLAGMLSFDATSGNITYPVYCSPSKTTEPDTTVTPVHHYPQVGHVGPTKHARNAWVSRSHYKGTCVRTFDKTNRTLYEQDFVFETDEAVFQLGATGELIVPYGTGAFISSFCC